MEQLALPLPHAAAFEPGSFFVSPSNRDAHAWITRWPQWPAAGLMLTGPEGAGKTHLAHIWRQRADACLLPPESLAAGFAPELLGGTQHAAVDDADRAPPRALLHLLNTLREQGGSVVVTSRLTPAAWPGALADLRSRLHALPAAMLHPPDDALLAALLTKLFADRQLSVTPDIIRYLAQHMERSAAAAAALVAHLDAAALTGGRNITLPLAQRVLESIQTTTHA